MRAPDWEQRLHDYVRVVHGQPHAWGAHDCLLFAGGVVRAVTGEDPARGHRGKYKSHAGAYRYLRAKLGADSPAELLDRLFPAKAVGFAGRGDLVLCRVDAIAGADGARIAGEVPGLCLGGFAMVVGEEGLERLPRGERWIRAWAVGEHHSGTAADG